MEHYLDNSATTKVSQKAAEKAFEIMTENYGNPSSLHLRGMYAEQELVKARKEVARKLGATADEIYFTSGGTEANNLAIFGVAEAKKRRGKRIVVSAVEHSSIMESAKKLEDNGFDVVYIMPREDGTIHKEDVLENVDENTILVSDRPVRPADAGDHPRPHPGRCSRCAAAGVYHAALHRRVFCAGGGRVCAAGCAAGRACLPRCHGGPLCADFGAGRALHVSGKHGGRCTQGAGGAAGYLPVFAAGFGVPHHSHPACAAAVRHGRLPVDYDRIKCDDLRIEYEKDDEKDNR